MFLVFFRLHLRLRLRLGFFFVVVVAVLAGGVPCSVLFSLLLVFSGFTSFLGLHFFLFPSLLLLVLAGCGSCCLWGSAFAFVPRFFHVVSLSGLCVLSLGVSRGDAVMRRWGGAVMGCGADNARGMWHVAR